MRKTMSAAVRELERAAVEAGNALEAGVRLAAVERSAFVELDPAVAGELAAAIAEAVKRLNALRYVPTVVLVEDEKGGSDGK